MAHFLMLVTGGVPSDQQRRVLSGARQRLLGQVGGLTSADIESRGRVASKMWLSHSSTNGFGRDAATGSWLAIVGNPTGPEIADCPADQLAGKILSLCLERGREAVTQLNAPFVCVLYDGREGSINVVTDRAGLQRIYVAEGHGATFVSTSALALAAELGCEVNPESVLTYFQVGHVLGEQTFFRGVRRVGPAKWVRVRGDAVEEETYWNPVAERGGSLDQWADEVGAAAVESLGWALRSGASTTVELTRGLDTRANLAAAIETGREFTAWTIGDINTRDTVMAQRLAAIAGVTHHVVSPLVELPDTFDRDFRLIHALTDGEIDCLNVIASPAANRLSSAYRKQSVTGVGGEMVRGFYYRALRALGRGINVRRLVDWQLCLGMRYEPKLFANVFADPEAYRLRHSVEKALASYGRRDALGRLDEFLLEGALSAAGGRSMTFNNFFYRQAAPLVSNRMLEASFAMPAKYRRNGLVLRRAIERLNPRIAAELLTTGIPARKLRAGDALRIAASRASWLARGARKAAAKLGVTPETSNRDAGLAGIARERLADMCRREILKSDLASEAIWKPAEVKAFVLRNVDSGMPDMTQVGLVMSMELTARAVGGFRA